MISLIRILSKEIHGIARTINKKALTISTNYNILNINSSLNNFMKRDLISMAATSALYVAIVFITKPFNQIESSQFIGLIGVNGYFIVKIIVERYYERKKNGR